MLVRALLVAGDAAGHLFDLALDVLDNALDPDARTSLLGTCLVAGEAKRPSRLSKTDISSQRRAGYRRTHGGSGRTRDQLYEEAKHRNIRGRSRVTKAQLERALR